MTIFFIGINPFCNYSIHLKHHILYRSLLNPSCVKYLNIFHNWHNQHILLWTYHFNRMFFICLFDQLLLEYILIYIFQKSHVYILSIIQLICWTCSFGFDGCIYWNLIHNRSIHFQSEKLNIEFIFELLNSKVIQLIIILNILT